MKLQKLVIAGIAICSLAALSAQAASPVMHGSNDSKVKETKGEGESFCDQYPWLCIMSTQGNNGGGLEPGTGKDDG